MVEKAELKQPFRLFWFLIKTIKHTLSNGRSSKRHFCVFESQRFLKASCPEKY